MFEDNKYLRFACVIQCQKKDYSNNLRERLENLSLLFPCKYYSIVHDKDILESGELKGLHIHLITTFNSRIRLKTALNRICNAFKIDDVNAVSIKPVHDFTLCIQYLIHKNNPEKFQYDLRFIYTNAEEELASQLLINACSLEYDGDLFTLCLNAENKIDVLKKIGFAKYSAYAKAIDLMFLERDKYRK